MPEAGDRNEPAGGSATGGGPHTATIRVMVIDDHRTLAELLGRALDGEDGVAYVGSATTAAEGLDLVTRLRPEVTLVDVQLPDLDGIALARRIVAAHPEGRVIMLTAATDPALVARAAEAGACGFMTKTGGLEELLSAIRRARAGAMVVDTALLAGLAGLATMPPRPRGPVLTPREIDVLRLLAGGRDTGSVARALGISLHTCRGHVKSIFTKLDCHSQLEAVVTAARLGLLELGF